MFLCKMLLVFLSIITEKYQRRGGVFGEVVFLWGGGLFVFAPALSTTQVAVGGSVECVRRKQGSPNT